MSIVTQSCHAPSNDERRALWAARYYGSGLHHPTNLQPLCRPCNERKQARTVDYRTPQQRAAVEAVWVIEFKKLEQR